MDQTYRIFTDGSAIGNPGPGGWGVVVIQGKKRWEMSGAHPWTTISEMELVAAVQALRSLEGRARIELALRLRIPDLWNARICLPLAAPRLAKPARNPTAAPRIVGGADRAEHNDFLSDGSGSKVTAGIATRARADELAYQAARSLCVQQKVAA